MAAITQRRVEDGKQTRSTAPRGRAPSAQCRLRAWPVAERRRCFGIQKPLRRWVQRRALFGSSRWRMDSRSRRCRRNGLWTSCSSTTPWFGSRPYPLIVRESRLPGSPAAARRTTGRDTPTACRASLGLPSRVAASVLWFRLPRGWTNRHLRCATLVNRL